MTFWYFVASAIHTEALYIVLVNYLLVYSMHSQTEIYRLDRDSSIVTNSLSSYTSDITHLL